MKLVVDNCCHSTRQLSCLALRTCGAAGRAHQRWVRHVCTVAARVPATEIGSWHILHTPVQRSVRAAAADSAGHDIVQEHEQQGVQQGDEQQQSQQKQQRRRRSRQSKGEKALQEVPTTVQQQNEQQQQGQQETQGIGQEQQQRRRRRRQSKEEKALQELPPAVQQQNEQQQEVQQGTAGIGPEQAFPEAVVPGMSLDPQPEAAPAVSAGAPTQEYLVGSSTASASDAAATGQEQQDLPAPSGTSASSSSSEATTSYSWPQYGAPTSDGPAAYGDATSAGTAYEAPGVVPAYGPYAAPTSEQYGYGTPAYGPPASEPPAYGPPASEPPTYGPSGSATTSYSPPGSEAPASGVIGKLAPVYSLPASEPLASVVFGKLAPVYGPPASDPPTYGPPGSATTSYAPPGSEPPASGAIGSAAPVYGYPPYEPPAYGPSGYTQSQTEPVVTMEALPEIRYNADHRNTVGLSGALAADPHLAINNKDTVKVEMIICPFAVEKDKHVQAPNPVKVHVWGVQGQAEAVWKQLRAGDTIAVLGTLRLDTRDNMRTLAGPVLTVDAVSVARVKPSSIPNGTYIIPFNGVYPIGMRTFSRNGFNRAGTPAGGTVAGPAYKYDKVQVRFREDPPQAMEDVAAWTSGVTLQDLAAQRNMALGQMARSVLDGQKILANSGQLGAPFDWQRLLVELGVDSELLAAIREGLEVNRQEKDSQGRVRMKPVRGYLLAHQVVGPAVKQQEVAYGKSPDVTFRQIEAVRNGSAAGGL